MDLRRHLLQIALGPYPGSRITQGIAGRLFQNADESGQDEAVCAVPGTDSAVLADIAFHQALWEASKSHVLKRQLTALLMPYFVYIVRVGYAAEKDMAESVVNSHQTLLNLNSSRNPNQARGYLMDMTLSYLERLNGFAALSDG